MQNVRRSFENLFRARKLGPAGTAILMLLPLYPLTWHDVWGPFLYTISGRLFFSTFDRIHLGALDQPSILKWFFLCTAYSAMTFPYIAVVRRISDRSTRWGYWAFAGPAAVVCVYLLGTFTVPFWWLLQYIHAMGFTPRRIEGLVFGLIGYAGIVGFLRWALGWTRQRRPLAAFVPISTAAEVESAPHSEPSGAQIERPQPK